jgi:hypothetical protein
MELLDEIIGGATDSTEPISNLLRRCLVLAHQLKNEKLKAWAESELNGYNDVDLLPDYRVARIVARGFFVGPLIHRRQSKLGREVNDVPSQREQQRRGKHVNATDAAIFSFAQWTVRVKAVVAGHRQFPTAWLGHHQASAANPNVTRRSTPR